jgi:hypothetical protein
MKSTGKPMSKLVKVTCFHCGGDHYASDGKCPPSAQQPKWLMAIWEEGAELPEGTQPVALLEQEPQEEDPPEADSNGQNDEGSSADAEALAAINDTSDHKVEIPLHGSQYSSEGEDYLLDPYEQVSHNDDGKQLFGIFDHPVLDDHDDWSTEAEENFSPKDDEDQFLIIMAEPAAGESKLTCVASQWVHRLCFPCERPKRPKLMTKPMLAQVTISGLPAVALFDTGSTTDAVSPKFAHVVDIKIFALEDPVALHLGCKGS